MPDLGLTLRGLLLPAPDLDESVRFYRDSLGLAVLFRDGDIYAELAAGGMKYALATPADHPVPNAALPMFRTKEMAAALPRLVDGGATLVTSPKAGEHEIRAVLRDPGGNPFVLYSSRG